MSFVADIPRSPSFEFNRPKTVEVCKAEYSGRRDPTENELSGFTFEQKVIPLEGGRQLLKLQKPLELRIDREALRFKVTDWGIEMDCLQLSKLPREIARRFLFLLAAADNERLSEQDQADWLRISDYVDFQQFTIERSAPRYMEGVLITKASVTIVEWHDGSRERLNTDAARALSEVNPRERFSAFVKLGKDDQSLAIERVSLLGASDAKEDWESWPEKS